MDSIHSKTTIRSNKSKGTKNDIVYMSLNSPNSKVLQVSGLLPSSQDEKREKKQEQE